MRPPIQTRRRAASDIGSDRRARGNLARPGEFGWRPARAVLGPDHPLTRATAMLERLRTQSAVAAAILLLGIAAATQGDPWAPAVAVSAAIVQIGFGIAAAAVHQRKRDAAIQIIADGGEAMHIAAVQQARERLSSARARRRLADAVDSMTEHATNPPKLCLRGARPLYTTKVVAAVAADLDEISRLLRSGRATIRGVARTERLVTNGASPLYGHEPNALREELHRIRRVMNG